MQRGTLPGLLLAARGDVTAAEVIVGVIMVMFLVAVAGLAWLVSNPLQSRAWGSYEAQLLEESREFRARWSSSERLREASPVELQAEIERCWRLILAMEHRMTIRDSPDVIGQIAAVRGWICAVADALNAG